jgi:hypothetical protein
MTFKPVGIEKFDGESDPKTWLRTNSIAVRAANSNNDIMAAYFPVMMSRQALKWLKALPAGSINSWDHAARLSSANSNNDMMPARLVLPGSLPRSQNQMGSGQRLPASLRVLTCLHQEVLC